VTLKNKRLWEYLTANTSA